MMIKQSCIEDVIERSDVVDVVRRYVDLKKSGANYTGCCPFHDEKTASFVVSPVKQIYKCFGCGVSGGVVKFVMAQEKKSFPEAIIILAGFAQVELEYDEAFDKEKHKEQLEEKEGVYRVNEWAMAQYKKAVAGAPEEVKGYIGERFTQDDVAEHHIGYAPAGGKFITSPLIEKGLYTTAIKAGLISEKNGQGWDFFQGRVIFPILNRDGRVVAFGGRVTASDQQPKYLNSIEHPGYNKSKTLFGLDKAAKEIGRRKMAYLVEGYTDVIAMQRKDGLVNTVATCGTSLTEGHVALLKRYCNHIVLLRDADKAGVKAAERDLKIILSHNMQCSIVALPEGEDPDSFLSKHETLPDAEDALLHYCNRLFSGAGDDAYLRANVIQEIIDVVMLVPSDIIQGEYLKQICKQFKLKLPDLQKQFTGLRKLKAENEIKVGKGKKDYYYNFPEEMKGFEEDATKQLDEFGLCVFNKIIYGRVGKEPPFSLMPVSNFSIEIIQHMHDEKIPKKLVRIENELGHVRIFDVESDALNTIRGLDKAVTNHGNFLFWGTESHFQALRKKLFSEMGVGKMIEQLGYQPEGFWATNNYIIKPDGSTKSIDDNGVYQNGKACYYLPSANKIYRTHNFKYQPQKKIKIVEAQQPIEEYFQQMKNVHREHSITGILYTIACVFSDIVYDKLKGFPLVFLHGSGSTGKDNMIMACQTLFGEVQAPLNLGNGASTMKAQIRKFAQFVNMAVNLSEYRRGDKRLNEYLKGLWGRDGYERGNIDSHFGTDTMPILSGVFITGNDYPDDDPLISRMCIEEFHKTIFSQKEKEDYRKLTAMYVSGVSSYLIDIFRHREKWEKEFADTQRKAEKEIKGDMNTMGTNERIFQNYGVLGSAYLLMRDVIQFPFTWPEVLAHLTKCITTQVRKQASGGKVSRFWDTFMACVRTKSDPLLHYQDFRVDGNTLGIQMLNVYGRMQGEWFRMNSEPAPAKSDIMEMLKQSDAYVGDKDSFRFGTTGQGKKSSALVFDLEKTGISGELLELLVYVQDRTREPEPVAMSNGVTNSVENEDELPF